MPLQQELPHRSAHQCGHHVVDGDPEVVLHLLDLGEIKAGERHIAIGGEAAVEDRRRCTERSGHRATHCGASVGIAHGLHGLGHNFAHKMQRPGGEPDQATHRDPHRPVGTWGRNEFPGGRVRFGAAQPREQFRVADTVGGCVMDLDHDGKPFAARRAIDALDDPHLPQRPEPIERQTGQIAVDLVQFRRAARFRNTDPVHMLVDVELWILHPGGVIGVAESWRQLLPELRNRPHALRQLRTETVVGVTAGNGRGVQSRHDQHLQGLDRGLEVQEAGVESGEPLWTLHIFNRTCPQR